MSDELKPCPLCNTRELSYFGNEKYIFHDNISNLCILGNLGIPFAEWQSRPLEDALQAKLEKAIEQLRRCHKRFVADKSYISANEVDNTIQELEKK